MGCYFVLGVQQLEALMPSQWTCNARRTFGRIVVEKRRNHVEDLRKITHPNDTDAINRPLIF